ncbi:bifunctional 5,10-methylenetetrahydrofolate dehydrogenase/5,10-methenyltetrahydrofolate cyclohydrolase [Sulfitobacter sp. M57]|uniref:bifunctional 5,10-methylenetetrahydrofolate dehydrogenase/5,10-methenyltetrahydrofolate cyclohydrolase n=1 Tax=unclassified Sulfitobacter TaxID=196795 RepID=UPI0023E20AA2|nr:MULTISPECIES: bifunctional 5,10-methylenetetrahydrofolate dehydrogenase/5,10-methenyltetrahydrofolate cyclohydrolase [unclassified Sulfitobacter]MDF3416452.1 bifunctional 5,10-methylenetetrahydrofolate dehydrogenase/5,10-methenyltetrahydrofolate cyclohydrolase [Sulfitobacter sp. KE5]MDF3423993.1 bifunctional 5,10-methylenetetrahydrofolate dehydrogenase/5,10-methenyltetrahydrofolate cyclohydrolase [Sulfitobacter sp. KE43]MDF3435094.1 bifunctional 5,10-methylenetetrahydrofolate dehydrogenase/5,
MPNSKDNRLIDGVAVKKHMIADVKSYVAGFPQMPRLVSILIGDVPEAAVYVRNQARGAEQAGLPFEQISWPGDITQESCKAMLLKMNDDPTVLGIILQRPVPDHINVRALQSAIHPLKDVEGMSPASIGNIVYSDVALAPCTAAASVALIKETGLPMEGLEVVMIGHSEIVGKPAAMMLMAEGCTVTVCHHMTRSVAMHSRRADVVVVAVGKAHLIGPDMIKPGAAVIDIGINQIETPEGPKIVGDVDTDAVIDVAGWISPVPGGVGPVTVAILMRNAMVAHQRQIAAGWL